MLHEIAHAGDEQFVVTLMDAMGYRGIPEKCDSYAWAVLGPSASSL